MIYVTRLNHTTVVLNSELIEHIETTPDTVISLTTGQKFMVLESVEEVLRRVMEFRRAIAVPAQPGSENRMVNGESRIDPSEDERYGRQ